MTLMTTISLLCAVFAMVVLSEIFKLKKEVRKLNKITKYILENDIHNEVNELSKYFMDKLNNLISEYEIIKEIRGMGLLIAMEFSADISAEIVSRSNEEGILINAVRPNAIRFMPPLTVTKSEIDQAIIKIKNAIGKTIR